MKSNHKKIKRRSKRSKRSKRTKRTKRSKRSRRVKRKKSTPSKTLIRGSIKLPSVRRTSIKCTSKKNNSLTRSKIDWLTQLITLAKGPIPWQTIFPDTGKRADEIVKYADQSKNFYRAFKNLFLRSQ